jgi:ABC-type lipoprotein release transport system permease subunit
MAVALDPVQDAKVFRLPEHVEGSWFGNGGNNQVVMGYKLARDLGLQLGDWVTLAARTRWEAQNADDFMIVGLINSTEPTINSSGVYISFADAEDFLELDGLRTESSGTYGAPGKPQGFHGRFGSAGRCHRSRQSRP